MSYLLVGWEVMKGIDKKRWQWLIVVCCLGLVIAIPFVIQGLPWSYWYFRPGSYVYTERRSCETPEAAGALQVAETFEYALLPVSDNMSLSTVSFFRGAVEYSVLPVIETKFLSNVTLMYYATLNLTFNPLLFRGNRQISYVANSTYLSSLDVRLNASAIGEHGVSPLVFASNSGVIAETWPGRWWRGGFWNGTDYTGYEYDRIGDYIGPSFLWLNYTGVFFVDMRLTIDRQGLGSQSFFGDTFWFYQRVIVDQTGRVLLVSYHTRYIAMI